MNFEIRQARAQDVGQIVPMVHALAEHHGDQAFLTEEGLIFMCFGPMPWATLFVAQCEDEVVGYMALIPKLQLQFSRKIMEIINIYVREDQRRQGICKALILAAQDHSRAKGCAFLTLGHDPSNQGARASYEAAGFVIASPRSEQMYLPL